MNDNFELKTISTTAVQRAVPQTAGAAPNK